MELVGHKANAKIFVRMARSAKLAILQRSSTTVSFRVLSSFLPSLLSTTTQGECTAAVYLRLQNLAFPGFLMTEGSFFNPSDVTTQQVPPRPSASCSKYMNRSKNRSGVVTSERVELQRRFAWVNRHNSMQTRHIPVDFGSLRVMIHSKAGMKLASMEKNKIRQSSRCARKDSTDCVCSAARSIGIYFV